MENRIHLSQKNLGSVIQHYQWFLNKRTRLKKPVQTCWNENWLRKSRQENVDQALLQWFKNTSKNTRNKGIPFSGPMLQEEAKVLVSSTLTVLRAGENCSGGKLSKDRITVMVAANLSVTEKKKIAYYWKISKTKMFYQC